MIGVIRYALGLTLGLAAAWKLRDFGAFRRSLGAYGLHGVSASAGAAVIIGAEALAAGLCFGEAGGLVASDVLFRDPVVGAVGTVLGGCFSVAQTFLLSSGKPAPCPCFGAAAAEPVSPRSWSRSVLVLLAGLLLLFAGRPGQRPLDPLLMAGGVLLVGGLSVLYRRMPRVSGSSPAAPPGNRGATWSTRSTGR